MHIINSITKLFYHFSTFEFKFVLISWQTIFFLNIGHRIIYIKIASSKKYISSQFFPPCQSNVTTMRLTSPFFAIFPMF